MNALSAVNVSFQLLREACNSKQLVIGGQSFLVKQVVQWRGLQFGHKMAYSLSGRELRAITIGHAALYKEAPIVGEVRSFRFLNTDLVLEIPESAIGFIAKEILDTLGAGKLFLLFKNYTGQSTGELTGDFELIRLNDFAGEKARAVLVLNA